MEKLDRIIFYSIEKAIKSYRRYAQKKLKENGFNITIDQWLVLKHIIENPSISQQEIGERSFKDNASVTRIIDLLIKSKYLKRNVNKADRRKTNLVVTPEGINLAEQVYKVAQEYRAYAVRGIQKQDIENVTKILNLISDNCKE